MNAILGIIFLLSGMAATFLMYHLWGYPYDKEKHQSSAPQSLVFVHRLLGYIYIGIYVYLMIQMVPRLWMYQIELPARTVVHLTCGILIGAILIIKLMIVRFFRHLEGTLIPALGTGLLLLTALVICLSVPFSIREHALNQAAISGGVALQENLTRVNRHLTDIGLADEVLKAQLSTSNGLILGRKVLNHQCVTCHDLRTVLVKPQTAKQWYQTVKSMASRADIFTPISQEQQWQVTAYLIAITPDLQRGVEQQRNIVKDKADSAAALKAAIAQSKPAIDSPAPSSKTTEPPATEPPSIEPPSSQSPSIESPTTQSPLIESPTPSVSSPIVYHPPANYAADQAKILFEIKCTDCHNVGKIEKNPPADVDQVRDLVARMSEKGMEATESEFAVLIHYLTETYANKP